MKKTVLLTGVTGFLGSHTAIQLLNKGYHVVGTLRSKDRIQAIRDVIARHTPYTDRLTFEEADLNDSNIWYALTQHMDYVQHIASPFPRELPKHENDLIVPARQGTLNILKASAENKVKRVVMVSSSATVLYGKTKRELDTVFNEKHWTDEANLKDTTPYFRSKTMAEKAAWDFIKEDNSGLELTTVLPGVILGTVLEEDFGTSANIIVKILDNSLPALPKIGFDIVDVSSLADLLIKAMELPQAKGNRYIASAGHVTFKDIALISKKQYTNRKISVMELPDFMARLFSIFEPELKPILLELGVRRKLEISKAKSELQWQPISIQQTVTECAKSIFDNKIVR